MLPDDVKENLLATGNARRVVELEPKPGEKVPSLISIDKLTNRLEAVPLDKLTVSQNLKGSELSPEQQQALKEGKNVLAEGMISKKLSVRIIPESSMLMYSSMLLKAVTIFHTTGWIAISTGRITSKSKGKIRNRTKSVFPKNS